MLEQQDLNKRLFLAIALSFIVLFAFSYLFPQQKQSAEGNVTHMGSKAVNGEASPAPEVSKVSSSSPATVEGETKGVPSKVKNGIVARVETEKYTLGFDSLGRISSVVLHEKKYRDEDGNPLELIDSDRVKPLEVRFENATLNSEAFSTPYSFSSSKIDATSSETVLTMQQKLSSVTVKKVFRFYPDGHYTVDVSAGGKEKFFLTTGHRPEADKSRYMIVRGSLVRDADGVITTIEDGDMEDSRSFDNITIVSSFDRYYASLFYDFEKPYSVVMMKDSENDPLPFVVSSKEMRLNAYIGPKEWKLFKSLDPRLTDAIEFGWFTFLSKPFFSVMLSIYNFVGNWGWAIVLFTLLVKLILFPLSYKGMMSMQKLKDLAPKMKEIKERYGKDPAKMNQQMMELYRKHGANPMGGCLPMLLQIPVFFALYRVLLNADELQGAGWILWINDLSRQDPYYVLPILMGVTMFIQQQITPNSMTDPLQQKIFKWFPVIMTFFFLAFPSGLVLYWLTNNILSIAQQYYINHAYEKHKALMKAKSASKKGKQESE